MDDAVRARIEDGQGTPEDAATVLAALTDCDDALSIVEGAVTDRDHRLTAAEAREARLREALVETLALAAVADDGDPWFASNAGIDAEAVIRQARAALSPEAEP